MANGADVTHPGASETEWSEALNACEAAAAFGVVRVPAGAAGWTETGVDLRRGQAASVFAQGKVWLSEELGIGAEGSSGLWRRIGEGPAVRVGSATASFIAEADGPLRLMARTPGAWLTEDPDDLGAAPETGGFLVAAIGWRGPTGEGLAALATADRSGAVRAEQARLAAGLVRPRGWRPHAVIGEDTVFHGAREAGAGPITCHCHKDVAIITHAIDAPLTESTRLSWSWRVSALPSAVAEDTLPTHDYLSIAAGFDNGLDLTWMWSAALPAESHFRCPLPWWDQREFHLVARSGAADLARWLAEDRPILADYRRVIGGPEPARITGIWLIAVSLFQGGTAEAEFSDIRITDGGRDLRVGG